MTGCVPLVPTKEKVRREETGHEQTIGGFRLSQEGQLLDQKSLRSVTGKSADWSELAKDCIAFANSMGGRLLLGIEDEQDQPPAGQLIPADLPDTIRLLSCGDGRIITAMSSPRKPLLGLMPMSGQCYGDGRQEGIRRKVLGGSRTDTSRPEAPETGYLPQQKKKRMERKGNLPCC
jgi:hypothetical protein